MMGLAREDLVYDVGRHVDASVHLLEEWGLPIWKKDNGEYERIGRWQIPIHGESIKPITAEPARKALGEGNLYERMPLPICSPMPMMPGASPGPLALPYGKTPFMCSKPKR